jgi:hypothetical protein
MYLIRISGYIPPEKVNEFRISADSSFARWKNLCTDLTFSKDLIYKDLCHYQSTWTDKDNYLDFIRSEDYKVLIGCFRVLGNITKITRGEMTPEQETEQN